MIKLPEFHTNAKAIKKFNEKLLTDNTVVKYIALTELLAEEIKVLRDALNKCQELMSGAPAMAPFTDEVILMKAEKALSTASEIEKKVEEL